MDIINEIREQYDSLSRTQKRIADYILNNTDAACFQTLKDWSRVTGVSESTILSFCSRFSGENFLGLKRELQTYIKRWVSPNEKIKRSATHLKLDQQTFRELMDTDRQNLNRTFEYLNPDEFYKFILELKTADHIHVVGHGISAPVAMMLQIRLQQTGVKANGLNILDHRAVVYEAANAGEDDLFVVIAFPNYAPQTVALVNYLHTVNARVVCITDKTSSPVALSARAVLLCNTDNLIFYNSMTAAISLVNLIAAALVLENKEKFSQHVEKLDEVERFLLEAQALNNTEWKNAVQEGGHGNTL